MDPRRGRLIKRLISAFHPFALIEMNRGGGPRPRLGGITDTSTVDWYGNVSLVAFFAGCNFRCPYCQNSGLLPMDSGEEVELALLRRRIDLGLTLLDSVVFTGGEPTLQPEALTAAADLVKSFGLKVMLDTNGSRPEVVAGLLEAGLVDRVALDVKAPLKAEDYGRVIGLPRLGGEMAGAVRRTLEVCSRRGVEVEARTTVAPTLSDGPDFIARIASDIKGMCDVYYLQQFDNTGDVLSPLLKAAQPPSREALVRLAEAALTAGLEGVHVKTREHGLERVG